MSTPHDNRPSSAERLPLQDVFDHAKRAYHHLQAKPSTGSGTTRYSAMNDPAAIIGELMALGVSAWRKLVFVAAVFFIGLGVYHHFQGLNEHSSCSSFKQANSSQQEALIQKMTADHPSSDSYANESALGIMSVSLYCTMNPNGKVDGVYGGN